MNHRENRLKNPTALVHHHAVSTATSTLRNHLGKAHRAEYNQICAQNGWKNHLAAAEIQKAKTAKVVARVAAREPFSIDGLLQRITRFIVADDQVSFFKLFMVLLSSNHIYSRSESLNAQSSVIYSFLHATILKIPTFQNVIASVL